MPFWLVGLDGFEPSTPALSRRCSNQVSYRPSRSLACLEDLGPTLRDAGFRFPSLLNPESSNPASQTTDRLWTLGSALSRKEVIQPHLPIRLPCYDFTPVMNLTVVVALLAVRLKASGGTHSHGVTGGVYKARERIHRDMLIRDY